MSSVESVSEGVREPLNSETINTISVCCYNSSIPYAFWCPLELNARHDQKIVLDRYSIVIRDLLYHGADFSEIVVW
jgi:hypothetical protein